MGADPLQSVVRRCSLLLHLLVGGGLVPVLDIHQVPFGPVDGYYQVFCKVGVDLRFDRLLHLQG